MSQFKPLQSITFLSLALFISAPFFIASAQEDEGLPTYSQRAADFDGDGIQDIYVFRAETGTWFIRGSKRGYFSLNWGIVGDIPVAADFTGSGFANVAVYRPSTGQWIIRLDSGQKQTIAFGEEGDVPVVGDYDGDGKADVSVFRPVALRDSDSTVLNLWLTRMSSSGYVRKLEYGLERYIPIPGDYDGDGKTDLAVYLPSEAEGVSNRFFFLGTTDGSVSFDYGIFGDLPVYQDFDGDGATDIGVYRTTTGEWIIHQSSTKLVVKTPWGGANDQPVPGDYDGDGKADIAVYRNGFWYILKSSDGTKMTAPPIQFGARNDLPIPFDFDQDGEADLGVFRPTTGKMFMHLSQDDSLNTANTKAPATDMFVWNPKSTSSTGIASYNAKSGKWHIVNGVGAVTTVKFGGPAFEPVPGDFDGDFSTDIAVYNPVNGNWHIKYASGGGLVEKFGGGIADLPLVGDFDNDGEDDRAIYREGTWFIRFASGAKQQTIKWGSPSHKPMVIDVAGDGYADLLLYNANAGTWHLLENSGAGFAPQPVVTLGGQSGDIPIPADYDGDGEVDVAIYRRGTYGQWWILDSSTGEIRTGDRPIQFGKATDIPGGQRIATVEATPQLDTLIGQPGPSGGFIWKPVSEGDHKLVVLLPRSLTDSIRAGWIADAKGEVIENGAFSGDSHNGGREHYRFSRKGADFGDEIYLVSKDRSGNLIHWPIPRGANRWDY